MQPTTRPDPAPLAARLKIAQRARAAAVSLLSSALGLPPASVEPFVLVSALDHSAVTLTVAIVLPESLVDRLVDAAVAAVPDDGAGPVIDLGGEG